MAQPKLARALLFLLLSALLPTLAAAQDARQDILAADDRRFAALVQGDLAALGGLLAEDMTYTHSSGQIETKAQLLESLRSGKLRYLSAEPADREVRLYGDTAVVTGRAAVKASVQGGPEIVLPLRFTEVWVRSGGTWKLAAWQSTRVAG
jgi:ketosteroid isomerase-like protein